MVIDFVAYKNARRAEVEAREQAAQAARMAELAARARLESLLTDILAELEAA